MSYYYIKLYLDLLDDHKMAVLPDWLWRRFIELLLVAKEINKDGELQPVAELAWRIRQPEKVVNDALRALEEIGVVHTNGAVYVVTNYAKRQAPVPDQERKERQRDRYSHAPVTKRDVNRIEENRIEENRIEEEGENPPPAVPVPVFSSFDTSQAVNSWGDNHARQAGKLYTAVTNQVCIPPVGMSDAMIALEALLDHYGKSWDRAVEEGKGIFSAWCNTSGKNGRNYSPTNTAWLTKWLEKIAPRPEAQDNTAASIAERMAQLARDAQRATR